MSSRFRQYLRGNWGAPFVLAFIVLLITSAGYLSFGNSATANEIAIYAFYSLVLGVGLQIASYVKYGEEKRDEPQSVAVAAESPSFRVTRRVALAIAIVIIIAISSGVGVFYYKQESSLTSRTTTRSIGPLSVGVSFVTVLPQQNNFVELLLGINQTGGLEPYNYTAYWDDNINQSNGIGVFVRYIFSNQSFPSSARVIVTSADGQTATVLATIPRVNRTATTSSVTSTTSASATSIPEITFAEKGLPNTSAWSVLLSGIAVHSDASQVDTSYPKGTLLSYTISGPYDAKNFRWAFVANPRTGKFIVNGSIRINIVFSNQSISIPSNRLFTPVALLNVSSPATSNEQIRMSYHNNFPAQVQAIVFATLTNNETGSVYIGTSTIDPQAFNNQTALFNFSGLQSGTYDVGLLVESSSGLVLSKITNSTFTLG